MELEIQNFELESLLASDALSLSNVALKFY